MKCLELTAFGLFLWVASAPVGRGQNVLINEIMYHPSSESILEEFVELHNAGPTNVQVGGWVVSGGIDFIVPPGISLPAGGYLVLAADTGVFAAKYPGVTPVVGNWSGRLSNSRNAVTLETASGERIDRVEYADEGDWAERARGPLLSGYRGWIWSKPHDGLGKSLELVNGGLPNEHGQNWAPSVPDQGTPGAPNSTAAANTAPLILNARHFPIVPRSGDPIAISARVIDEAAGVTVNLRWRVDSGSPPPFAQEAMRDDGAHGDGAAGDGIYGVVLPSQAHGTLLEFFVEAEDAQGHTRTWPAPARQTDNSLAQTANALLQVDDEIVSGSAPLYKLIMTTAEYQELGNIFSGSPQSDAQMNATFIDVEGSGTSLQYLVGVRNRGHGSRSGNPHNYRLNFRSDDMFDGKTGLNLNARSTHAQIMGAALAQKAGADGADSRAARLRVNGSSGPGGTPNFGIYAANEAMDSRWAESHYPDNGGGNIYKVIRDIRPPNFNYRGEDPNQYRNTYFKQSNESEDDWTDLIGMLRVMGENSTMFNPPNARQVIDVDQWMTHVAVMSMFGNNESGINSGNNDDYYLYSGDVDRRVLLIYHDLDSILGQGSMNPAADIFRAATCCPISGDSEGIYRALNQFLRYTEPEGAPEDQFEALYYATFQRLLDTTFAKEAFDRMVTETLGEHFPNNTIDSMINWMDQRRASVQSQIDGNVPLASGRAALSGEPRSPTWTTGANLTVGGTDIVGYSFRLNHGSYSAEFPVGTQIRLTNLPDGSTNTVYVVGRHANGQWQSLLDPTASSTWVVKSDLPRVRLNEVLARNDSAHNHQGTFPDIVELANEFVLAFDLSGMSLTDDPAEPDKFVFPAGTSIPSLGFLTLFANEPDGTPGIHLGFSLDQNGEALYLFDAPGRGGALLDSVTFGHQLANRSFGRIQSPGAWFLTSPSPGAANVAVAVGDPALVRINEWLASGQSPIAEDFVELYNPGSLPVCLQDLYLTDRPVGAPRRHRFPHASYMDPGGFLALVADGEEDQAGHVGFALSAAQGTIALMDSQGQAVDCILYGPQTTDVARGRCPNGGPDVMDQELATPGAPNFCAAIPVDPQVVNLVPFSQTWRYEVSNTDLGAAWRESGYNDSAWPEGQGLLGYENGDTPLEPIRTLLTQVNGRVTTYYRTQFDLGPNLNPTRVEITHLIDDGAIFYVNGTEVGRFNMGAGAVGFTTLADTVINAVYVGPLNVPVNLLEPTGNVLAVQLHQNNVSSADQLFGLRLDALVVTNAPSAAGVIINEVLADNAGLAESDGSTPDWVELYNPSNQAANLAGLSLSDSLTDPLRYVFPSGSIIPAQGRLVLRMDGALAASGENTGFALDAGGDALYLFDTPAAGGGILDFVQFGMQTPDYALARLPDGGPTWNLAVPTLGSANVAAVLGDAGLVRINEWMADPISGDDWFELYNPSGSPVAVGGYFLSDDLSNPLKSVVPARSYLGAGTNAWRRLIADGDAGAGADHADFSLSNDGESLGFFTPAGLPIDAVSFGPQAEGVSEGRFPDGASSIVAFPETESPGESNYRRLLDVAVNEVLTHTDSPLEDAIELRNTTGASIDIGGWWLSDERSVLEKYQIPPGTILAPGGYAVFYEYRLNDGDVAAIPFSLSSAKGDDVHLSAANGGARNGFRHTVEFGPAANGVSMGRYETSVGVDFVRLTARTFGVDTPGTVEAFRMGAGLANAAPSVGPVVISEIMYHPPDLNMASNERDEFVELHNVSGTQVNLFDTIYPTNTWRLREGIDYEFPMGATIPAGGYVILVSFDPATNAVARAGFESVYGSNLALYGPYRNRLANDGESIELRRPDTPQTTPGPDFGLVPYIAVDRIDYLDRAPWPVGGDGDGLSLQRISATAYGNDPINWQVAAPSPGPGSVGPGDSDGDGMPDEWESDHGLNPNVNDAGGDPDQDGLTNLEEYMAGTDPQDPGSRLHLTVESGPGGAVILRFDAAPGKTYRVLYRLLPDDGIWQVLATVPASGTPVERTAMDSSLGAEEQRFYRVTTP